MRKEIVSGLCLGGILGVIGFIRIMIWQQTGFFNYGEYWFYIALSISFSLVLIVLWGTLSGSMIPFVLKRLKLDPATSSAPFVATLVDVTGLIIYFTIAGFFLSGKPVSYTHLDVYKRQFLTFILRGGRLRERRACSARSLLVNSIVY